jgi:flagellar motor switch protein FliN/FliY
MIMTDQAEEIEQQSIEQQIDTQGHSPSNLESLMHIPLEVSVELGRVKLPLHSVVRIARGTVLPMGKEADSQVDILANGSIFARGEVVKADGKLGVRITNIVTPAERIRALS